MKFRDYLSESLPNDAFHIADLGKKLKEKGLSATFQNTEYDLSDLKRYMGGMKEDAKSARLWDKKTRKRVGYIKKIKDGRWTMYQLVMEK